MKWKKRNAPKNDNTVLFSSLLLDACIVPVSVPLLDSRQLQQQQPLMNNQQQHQQQYQQNNSPGLAYQQANNHNYTNVTGSQGFNKQGPGQGQTGPMGPNQMSGIPPHLQQQVSKNTLKKKKNQSLLIFSILLLSTFILFLATYFIWFSPNHNLMDSTVYI